MTKKTKRYIPRAHVELDVSPTWWKGVHHRKNGAFSLAMKLLLPRIYERGLEPIAIRATQAELTITVAADKDTVVAVYHDHAEWLREELTKEITIEASDMRSGILDTDAEAAEAEQTVTRAELEEVLKLYGMQPTDWRKVDPKPDDKDIWSTTDAEEAIQFDERTGPGDTGKARLMTIGGERSMTFEALHQRYSGRVKATSGPSAEEAEAAGIFPADGHAHGGVFGKEGAKHG